MNESLKEGGRSFVLGVVSYLLTEGVLANLVEYYFGTKIDPTLKYLIIGTLLYGFRSLDSFLHEANKALPVKERNDGYGGEKGITF